MKFFKTAAVLLSVTVILVNSVSAEKLLVLKIGPMWPRVLLGGEKSTAWDASIISGLILDKKVAFGGGLDFLWNRNIKQTHETGNTYLVEQTERTLAFPLSAYLSITPFPDLVIYPGLSGQIGLNTMYFSHKEASDTAAASLQNENGWYMGFIGKIAADVHFNLGESTALFTGIEYQWSTPKLLSRKQDESRATYRKMSGIGIRMGLRAAF